ncbi:hypothetical protein E2C01_006581 [Portunus trituberculatus]|uniref:Uncharacterized protein n=1 Tax=Portunus trituberculatus TaxID=210409 RepID=A0A5B7D273_PORTR|nr:hypothetical protein [Portunus trituberculatus]
MEGLADTDTKPQYKLKKTHNSCGSGGGGGGGGGCGDDDAELRLTAERVLIKVSSLHCSAKQLSPSKHVSYKLGGYNVRMS